MLVLLTSCGRHVVGLAERVVVMSEARSRKQAVWLRAGRSVVGRWVVRKVESQVGEGVRPFVVANWAVVWDAGLDIIICCH